MNLDSCDCSETLKDIKVEVGTALEHTEQSLKDKIALKSLLIQIIDSVNPMNRTTIANKLDMRTFVESHNQHYQVDVTERIPEESMI